MRPRDRDLYEALVLPIGHSYLACTRLLECLKYQLDLNREPMPPDQGAVLESLFKQIHVQPEQEAFALRLLRDEADLNLAASGERFHLSEKVVSNVLRSFGFLHRKRTNSGWVVLIDRAARKLIHKLVSQYGANSPSACLPSEELSESCEFCKAQDPKGGAADFYIPRAPRVTGTPADYDTDEYADELEPPLNESAVSETPANTDALTQAGSNGPEHSEPREPENSMKGSELSTEPIGYPEKQVGAEPPENSGEPSAPPASEPNGREGDTATPGSSVEEKTSKQPGQEAGSKAPGDPDKPSAPPASGPNGREGEAATPGSLVAEKVGNQPGQEAESKAPGVPEKPSAPTPAAPKGGEPGERREQENTVPYRPEPGEDANDGARKEEALRLILSDVEEDLLRPLEEEEPPKEWRKGKSTDDPQDLDDLADLV